MNKKEYIIPTIEIIDLAEEDILTASVTSNYDPDELMDKDPFEFWP